MFIELTKSVTAIIDDGYTVIEHRTFALDAIILFNNLNEYITASITENTPWSNLTSDM